MNTRLKHSLLKQTLIYGTSLAIMKGISLLMLPFIAQHIETREFGRLEIISSLAILGSILVGFGLEETLYRFAGSEQDPKKQKPLVATLYTLSMLIGGLFFLLIWLISPVVSRSLPGAISTYEVQIVLAVLALEGCIAIPLGWLRMQDKAMQFFCLTTGRAIVQAGLTLILLTQNNHIRSVLEASLIAALLQAFVLSYLLIRQLGIGLKVPIFRSLLGYSLPIMLSGFVTFALMGFDRWVLAQAVSIEHVGLYGVAFKFALASVLLLQPYSMWWSPKRFIILNGPDGLAKAAHYTQLGIGLVLIITLVVGLIAPGLITMLMPDNYHAASQYMLGLVIMMALKESAELVNIGCYHTNTTHAQLLINLVCAILGILLMFVLVDVMSVWGIIMALCIAQAGRVILFYRVSQKILPLPYRLKPLLLATLTCISLLGAGYVIPDARMSVYTVAATTWLVSVCCLLKLFPMPLNHHIATTKACLQRLPTQR